MLFIDQPYTTSRRQKDIPGREKMRRQEVWKARYVREVIKIPHWVKKGKECGFDLEVYGTNLKICTAQNRSKPGPLPGNPCFAECPIYCRMFSSILGFYPLDVISTSSPLSDNN